jgi:hypothetical protein
VPALRCRCKSVANVVDEDGFTKVMGKKAGKKAPVQVKTSKTKLIYRPVLVRTTDTHKASSSGSVPDKPNKTLNPLTSKVKVHTSNPFDVLAGEEDRVIDPSQLADLAAKMSGKQNMVTDVDDENVEEVYNEMADFIVSGTQQSFKGASTPSVKVSND